VDEPSNLVKGIFSEAGHLESLYFEGGHVSFQLTDKGNCR